MKKNWTIKTGKALAACLLAFSLAACSGAPKNEEPAAGQYKAGTYTASAQGNNGPVELEVTFTADAITSVVVKSQQETEAIESQKKFTSWSIPSSFPSSRQRNILFSSLPGKASS